MPTNTKRKVRQSLVTQLVVKRIKRIREKTLLTLAEIGRLASVSRSALRCLLAGAVEPSAETLERLNTTLDALELLGGDTTSPAERAGDAR